MILRQYIRERLRANKKLRYSLVAVCVLGLAATMAYHRLSKGERIAAEQVVDCPALERGCQLEVRQQPYRVTTDAPIAAGTPFVLTVEGGGVQMRAVWKKEGASVAPNHYLLRHESGEIWRATMSLPESADTGTAWILHLELNARAVDIRTSARR